MTKKEMEIRIGQLETKMTLVIHALELAGKCDKALQKQIDLLSEGIEQNTIEDKNIGLKNRIFDDFCRMMESDESVKLG